MAKSNFVRRKLHSKGHKKKIAKSYKTLAVAISVHVIRLRYVNT